MSLHLEAKSGEVADTVLLSGDPLRATYVAEKMLEKAVCYNKVRNMFGYTGLFKGQRISVQGTGMGQPSLGIYTHELIREYGVKRLIRIGTCGALREDIKIGDIIIAQAASTDANINKITFGGLDFAPIANFDLLKEAVEVAQQSYIPVSVGNVFSTDIFYADADPKRWKVWRNHGMLCAEMETSLLYTISAKYGVEALSILTVSDNIVTGEAATAEMREKHFHDMVSIALEIPPA